LKYFFVLFLVFTPVLCSRSNYWLNGYGYVLSE
jgi:hypothetical protein